MGEKVQSHKTAVLTPCNILFRFLSNWALHGKTWANIPGVAFCLFFQRQREPPLSSAPTHPHHTTHTTAFLPPLFLELALFRLFLFLFSFFFSSERGIVWQLFLLVDWNRERENSVTHSVSNFQRKLPPLPQTLYTYSGKHTLPSGLDHSSNRATVKAAFNAVLFFSFL